MGTLVTANDRWEWRGTYEERAIPKAASFRWDPDRRVWWTKLRPLAMKLAEHGDPETRAQLLGLREAEEAAAAASRASTADIVVPAPPGCEYLPFQLAGIKYALNTKSGNCLIGDAMGVGKTIEALGVLNYLAADVESALVICPATVKLNWAREAAKWLTMPASIRVWQAADEITPLPIEPGGLAVHIVNWDILATKGEDGVHARPDILALRPQVLILDECQRMKSPKAQRTVATQELAATAERILALTGTPITNRPIELWTTIHLLDPKEWQSKSWYTKRYCNGHVSTVGYRHPKTVYDDSGASHLDELQDRLRRGLMVRRLKEDVLRELPAKRRTLITLEAAKYADVLAREQQAIHKGRADVAALREEMQALDKEANADEWKASASALRQAYSVAFTEISRVRHETALAKVQDVARFTDDALDAEAKVLLWAHHHDVIAALARLLHKHGVVTLTGEHSQAHRDEAIQRFQTDDAIRVFIGSIQAGGLGITLTAASTVIFGELDWTPANISQAEDRAHRIGQVNPVSVYHLVVDGSIDARMAELLVEKQEIIDLALDTPPERLNVKPSEVLGFPSAPKADPDAFAFTEAERDIILTCMQELSARCDGALERDAQGFNKMHARRGHMLASVAALTDAQAELGIQLAQFYRGQLTNAARTEIERIHARWKQS